MNHRSRARVSRQSARRVSGGAALAERHLADGSAAVARNDFAHAIAAYQRAIEANPKSAEAHNDLANAYRSVWRLDDAVAGYRRAIELAPDFAIAWFNLGVTLLDAGMAREALAILSRARDLRPAHTGSAQSLILAYKRLGRMAEALPLLAEFEGQAALEPGSPLAHVNLALAYAKFERIGDAAASLITATRLDPRDADTLGLLGMTLLEEGRYGEALAAFDHAIALRPNDAAVRFYRSLELLRTGQLARGFEEYEWRWRHLGFSSPRRDFPQPLWDGADLTGRTILLHTEQGLGDSLQFIRYAPLVAARGGTVVVECERPLTVLFESCAGVSRVVAKGEPLPRFDVHAPLLSLPRLTGTTLETIPADIPYLRVPSPASLPPRRAGTRLRVGIVWAGSGTHVNNLNRSVDLRLFDALIARDDLDVVSLQKGEGLETLIAHPMHHLVTELGSAFHGFHDTAAAMSQLDLVISVDTAPAHLAGALGVPVWILLPANADWRWMVARDDSPWYPSARLYRQAQPGDWSGAFRCLMDDLDREVAGRPAAESVPVDRAAASREFAIAVARHQAGDAPAAADAYRRALVLDPGMAEAHNNLGVLLRRDDLAGALALFRRAIAARPGYADALANAGAASRALGDPAGAVPLLREALTLRPGHSDALTALGHSLLDLGDLAGAETTFRDAVAAAPDSVAALNNLGHVVYRRGDLEGAIALFQRAIKADPASVDALNNLGLTLRDAGFARDAEVVLRGAVDRAPGDINPIVNLAAVLADLGDTDQAIVLNERALSIDPRCATAMVGLGNCAADRLDYPGAAAWFERALAVEPENPHAHWNRGMVRLASGDYRGGWNDFEWRWKLIEALPNVREFAQPRWTGADSPLEGRTILLYCEQGLGDTFQFVRFARELKRRWTVKIVIECPPPLAALLRECDYLDQVVEQGTALPAFDVWLPLLTLPRRLGITMETLDCASPYLSAPRRPIADAIPPAGGALRVGIVWGGRTDRPRLAVRSIGLDALAPLAAVPGIRLFGLQMGPPRDELAGSALHGRVTDLSPHIRDFADTAAALEAMDLVITIDTSVAHLAGAMHVPVWILLPHAADWRWVPGGAASPWYPSARLFRQPVRGDWASVVRDVTHALRALGHAPPAAEGFVPLPSVQRTQAGQPRFTLHVPVERLTGDPAGLALFQRELAQGGVDRHARMFLEEQLRTGDLFVDVGAGWGFTALSAATVPGQRVQVLAVLDSAADADNLSCSAAANALTGTVDVAVAPSFETISLDTLLDGRAGGGQRVFVRVADPAMIPAVLSGARNLVRSGGLAALIWTCRRDPEPEGGRVALDDEHTIQRLLALGFSHFVLTLGTDGAAGLSLFPSSPADTALFSLSRAYLDSCLAESDAAPPAAPAPVVVSAPPPAPVRPVAAPVPVVSAQPATSRPTLAFDWRLSPSTGWGVYGLNLALHCLRGTPADARPMPLMFTSPDLDGVDADQLRTLGPALTLHREVAATLESNPGKKVSGAFTMLRSLANNLHPAVPQLAAEGARNVGVVFFEDSRIDAAGLERGRRFDRIIAGSTWNAEVMRAHGLDNVRVALQGIDPSIFKPGPRSRRFGDRFVVFSGGKLEYRKGQDIVIAAFRAFRERHPDALLMLAWHNQWPQTMGEIATRGHVTGVPDVGPGGRLDIVGWLAKNGVPADAVVDLGKVANREMGGFLREADVALFPNRCEGGTNLVAMECMAAAVPTILSANTGHLDIAADAHALVLRRQEAVSTTPFFRGVEGWGESSVDEAVAALESVYADRGAAVELGRRGSRAMHELSWDAQIGKMLGEISDLL